MVLLDKYGDPLYNGERLSLKSSNAQQVVIDLARKTLNLTKKDIKYWRSAWQMAINVENPRRGKLLGVYYDTDVDMHVTGCIGQRTGVVLNQAFKVIDTRTRKKDDKLTEIFEADWFKDLMLNALLSRYWGPGALELGPVTTVRGKMRFDRLEVIPREHLAPEFGVILRDPSDDFKTGYSYINSPLTPWVIPLGKPGDLGLFLKVSPAAISKRNMGVFWDTFGEMFGIPVRIGYTSTKDATEIDEIENMLSKVGPGAYGVFPDGTKIEFKEAQKSDAFMVFDKRIARNNTEMSKGLLCQTMTLEDGSSLSQSEVHLKMFERVVASDADFVRDLVNNELIPRMQMHGFPLTDFHQFEWDYSVESTPDQCRAVESMLLQYYHVDPKYFVDKYNINITGERMATADPAQMKTDISGFFA